MFKTKTFNLYLGDCLELLKNIPDESVDMICTDLPYGVTGLKWDSVIDFTKLWIEYRRVIKPRGAIVLTAVQPFTSLLVNSNLKDFRTNLVWNKKQSGSFALPKYHPLRITEDILVFGKQAVNYYPIMRKGKMRTRGDSKKQASIQNNLKMGFVSRSDEYYPTNIIEIANTRKGVVHPTQKPVDLMVYLITTYSKEGDVILDSCMGSGTTGVAALQIGRKFIGMEKDVKYFEIAQSRIDEAYKLCQPKAKSRFSFSNLRSRRKRKLIKTPATNSKLKPLFS